MFDKTKNVVTSQYIITFIQLHKLTDLSNTLKEKMKNNIVLC